MDKALDTSCSEPSGVASVSTHMLSGDERGSRDTPHHQSLDDSSTAVSGVTRRHHAAVLAELASANCMIDELKAAYGKSVRDASAQKQAFAVQLDKAHADAVGLRAAFDASVADAKEQKQAYDSQLHQAHADAAKLRVAFDHELLTSRQDAFWLDARVNELTAQANHAQLEADAMRQTLASERQRMAGLQDEHAQLQHQQELLQAELQVALHTYKPTAVIDAGTPADKLLTMLSELLEGKTPSVQDILFVQSCVLESLDLYAPVDLGRQLQGAGMDKDVGLSLLNQLADRQMSSMGGYLLPANDGASVQELTKSASDGAPQDERFQTLQGALLALLSPTFSFQLEAEPASRQSPLRATTGISTGAAASVASSSAELPCKDKDGPHSSPHSMAGLSSLIHRKSMRFHASEARDPGSPKVRTPTRYKPASSSEAVGLIGVGHERSSSTPLSAFADNAATEDDERLSPTCVSLSPPPFDEVNRLLEAASSHWQFDAFQLAEATHGCPLSAITFFTIHQAGLIAALDLHPEKLARFLRRVESGYPDNAYHSAIHAADVVQTLSLLLRKGGLLPHYACPVTHLAALLAAAAHDFGHLGRTNDFLVTTGHELALVYNDRAPLENHHISSALGLLRCPEYNFLASLSKGDGEKLRRTMIELVLATDMKQHFATVSHFTTLHRLGSTGNTPPAVSSSALPRCGVKRSSDGAHSSSLASSSGDMEEDPRTPMVPLDDTERLLTLQMALKCADLGHTAAALPVHLRWVAALEEELFQQGDAERLAGLPISPLFDRAKQGVSKSQVGFYDIVVIPLFHAWTRVFTSTRPLMACVMRNYRHWEHVRTQSAGQAGQ